ncbi:MAG: hypothetical protein SGJ26_17455 [Nitrospirota bacterium]|nr:hypothetical protein [Nitrospirota bacterium]
MFLRLIRAIIHASHRLVHAGFDELTSIRSASYARSMTTRLIITITVFLLMGAPGAVAGPEQKADAMSAEDYALYDQVVTSKFLTSATQLVVIERMTRLRLSPDQEGPTTVGAFQEQGYFDGEPPADLIRELISANRQASRLEGRFHFAAGYRFVTEGRLEEPEVSLARPVTVAGSMPVQAPPVLDRLAFSRVARNLRNDQALLYVEMLRPDGTGAGFLVWCRRQGRSWIVFDTEVAWTMQVQVDPEEVPQLAP